MSMGINSAVGHRSFDLFKDEAYSENAELVTLTSSVIAITSIDLGTFKIGDRIWVEGYFQAAKGGTDGDTLMHFGLTGSTGVILYVYNQSVLQKGQHHKSGATTSFHMAAIGRVTTAGTIIILLSGSSYGSDSTVPAGSGELYVTVLKR